eukprot:6204473-Pleurochrysis_carterae.AAC.3
MHASIAALPISARSLAVCSAQHPGVQYRGIRESSASDDKVCMKAPASNARLTYWSLGGVP